MPDERSKSGELVLATGQYAHILDRTKGNVCVYVGPSKTSLSETDQPILWDSDLMKFRACDMRDAVRTFPNAPEGSYVVLTNPAKEKSTEHPKEGAANSLVQLEIGRKVNIHGPSSFALWYQQSAEVVPGHLLRSNQYLVVRVYNEEAAKANWSQAVIKRQKSAESTNQKNPELDDEQKKSKLDEEQKNQEGVNVPDSQAVLTVKDLQEGKNLPEDLSMGQRFILKGTDLAFYMPSTGLEVLKDEYGNYVRDAVSLEQLEYCVLLNEDGAKRFVHGPIVVFPSPTETFLEVKGKRKFKAIELNPHSGIYVKVIAPYEESSKKYEVGEELFITGKTQAIYFPRPEHAIIKYGEQIIHYAVAVPAGEGRYVLNRDTGEVRLVKGPTMLLPDPRKEVIVRRVLEEKQVKLWYPGNSTAVKVNTELLEAARESNTASIKAVSSLATGQLRSSMTEVGLDSMVGEEFGRKADFTPPRTITLDNKYEGAVEVNVWSGYAILVVSKTGKRAVIQGPVTKLLEFDESLMATELSTGTPKSSEGAIKTAYLRVLNNRVSDQVEAETKDLVDVSIRLSYRVNFEGDSSKWFDVENYIQFMCDHTRSLIRNMVKKLGIQEFHDNAIDLIRDAVLGKIDGNKSRPGRAFKENGMRIYDVEVLDIEIGDEDISDLMVGAQHQTVEQTLRINRAKQDLRAVKEEQSLVRERKQQESETAILGLNLKKKVISEEAAVEMAQVEKSIRIEEAQEKARLAIQEILDEIAKAEFGRRKAENELSLDFSRQKQEISTAAEEATATALVKKARGFSPALIASLQAFSDRDLAGKVAKAMAPLAILRDKSVADAFVEMVKGTGLENTIGGILNHLNSRSSTEV